MQAALFPVPEDLVWPPPEYAGIFVLPGQQAPQQVLTDYALPPSLQPPPPPPPPPTQKIGPTGSQPIVELAVPPPHVAPEQPAPPLQPGLGIPQNLLADAGAPDPWAGL